MPSASLIRWQTARWAELDEIEAAHRAIGGSSRGRRFATQQINHAFVLLLSSQFQGFCRDLHGECLDALVRNIQPPQAAILVRAQFSRDLKLTSGNPNPGNIGADFGRFGIDFWNEVQSVGPRSAIRKTKLEALNRWRNAIAHQDFDPKKLYPQHLFPVTPRATSVQLGEVQDWRGACNGLASTFDRVLYSYWKRIIGSSPW